MRNQGGFGSDENGEKEDEKEATGSGDGSEGERFFNVLWYGYAFLN